MAINPEITANYGDSQSTANITITLGRKDRKDHRNSPPPRARQRRHEQTGFIVQYCHTVIDRRQQHPENPHTTGLNLLSDGLWLAAHREPRGEILTCSTHTRHPSQDRPVFPATPAIRPRTDSSSRRHPLCVAGSAQTAKRAVQPRSRPAARSAATADRTRRYPLE